jgi:hypothetical protein
MENKNNEKTKLSTSLVVQIIIMRVWELIAGYFNMRTLTLLGECPSKTG